MKSLLPPRAALQVLFWAAGILLPATPESAGLALQNVSPPPAASPFLGCSQFGAKGDGVTDDTAALQAGVDTMFDRSTSRGRMLICGPGTYLLTKTVSIENARQFTLAGIGGQTQFSWGGPPGIPMFRIHGRDFTMENFRIVANAKKPLAEAIRLENVNTHFLDPGHGTIRKVVIECTDGGCQVPIRLPSAVGRDANNDLWHFEENVISNYSVCAVSIEGSQEHNIHFNDNEIYSNRFGKYAICGKSNGTAGAAANFDWQDGFIGGNTGADFYLGAPQVLPYLIRGLSSEGSCKFIKTDGPTGFGTPVLIEGVRWNDDAPCATGEIMQINWPGPIRITSSTFGLDYKKPKTFAWQYFGGSSAIFDIEDSILRAPNNTVATVFNKRVPTRISQFSVQTSDTHSFLLDSSK